MKVYKAEDVTVTIGGKPIYGAIKVNQRSQYNVDVPSNAFDKAGRTALFEEMSRRDAREMARAFRALKLDALAVRMEPRWAPFVDGPRYEVRSRESYSLVGRVVYGLLPEERPIVLRGHTGRNCTLSRRRWRRCLAQMRTIFANPEKVAALDTALRMGMDDEPFHALLVGMAQS